jgi:hypothetical protein
VSYNPFGTGGPDNPATAAQAVAGVARFWSTNRYTDGRLGKSGVGLYVRLASPVAAAQLALSTTTPGFDVQVWGAQHFQTAVPAGVHVLGPLGWRLLGADEDVQTQALLALGGHATPYRYYLVWITRLELGAPGASVSAAFGNLRLLSANAPAA